MPKSLSSQISFVLVQPQFAGNAGAAARALKNTGFKKLTLVKPWFTLETEEAKQFAVQAGDILKKAVVVDCLLDAVKDCRLVIGTSRREGAYRKNFVELSDFPRMAREFLPRGEIAILFGNETSGLSNEELEYCHHILRIPADSRYGSYNLAQAVLLVAFELFRSNLKPRAKEKVVYPKAKELEGMYFHLTEMLTEVGFMRKTTPYHMPRILRNILGRAHLTEAEVRVVRGICRQVLWYKKKCVGA
jgi:tRNA/rRNA methyltransferase